MIDEGAPILGAPSPCLLNANWKRNIEDMAFNSFHVLTFRTTAGQFGSKSISAPRQETLTATPVQKNICAI